MSKWATMIFQMLSMRLTLTRAVSTSLLIANVLICAKISPSVDVRAFAELNIGEWKFSSTPTVSYARAQISSARLCISKSKVLVNRESKDSYSMCKSVKRGSTERELTTWDCDGDGAELGDTSLNSSPNGFILLALLLNYGKIEILSEEIEMAGI